MSQKVETLLVIYMQKDMGNPIKPMRMTENGSKWLIWLIFVNSFEKWLILKHMMGLCYRDDLHIDRSRIYYFY